MSDLYTVEELEQAEQLFRQSCTFACGAAKIQHLPDSNLPEVAFAGRSNVGKSSLINALINRRNLARTSKTPGRTQEINFFNLNDTLFIVDLPGYGFAQVSKRLSASWNETILLYLKGRVQLKRVFLLIDSRHGLKDVDYKIMDLLDEAAVSYQIVLTKIDKLKQSEVIQMIDRTQAQIVKRPAAHPIVLSTSSEKKNGIDLLKAEASRFALS